MARWKRRDVTTDSSVEQGLEVGRSPGGQLTAEPGNGQRGRRHELRAQEGTDPVASAARPRTSSSLVHLLDVGVRFGGSEHPEDPGTGPPALPLCFGGCGIEPASVEIPQAPASRSGEPLFHFGGGCPPPPEAPSRASALGGRTDTSVPARGTPSASGSFGCRGRWLRPSHAKASAFASREEARWLRLPGGPHPAPLLRKGGGPRENRRKSASSWRKTPTNLFATYFECPGNRTGRDRRTDGNDRKETDAAMQKRLLTRGTLRRE